MNNGKNGIIAHMPAVVYVGYAYGYVCGKRKCCRCVDPDPCHAKFLKSKLEQRVLGVKVIFLLSQKLDQFCNIEEIPAIRRVT